MGVYPSRTSANNIHNSFASYVIMVEMWDKPPQERFGARRAQEVRPLPEVHVHIEEVQGSTSDAPSMRGKCHLTNWQLSHNKRDTRNNKYVHAANMYSSKSGWPGYHLRE